MTTEIREGRQSLIFDGGWTAIKWDDAPEYRKGLSRFTDGVAACDVIAARPPHDTVVVAEFKDQDNPNTAPEERANAIRRATSTELIDELVRKTYDTLMGATFAHETSHERAAEFDAWDAVIQGGSRRILVLFCVEVTRSQAAIVVPWTAKLKKRFRCLGPDVQVFVTSREAPFDQLGIRYAVHSPAASDE